MITRRIGRDIRLIFKNTAAQYVNPFTYVPDLLIARTNFRICAVFLKSVVLGCRFWVNTRRCADCKYTNGPSSIRANASLGLFLCTQYLSPEPSMGQLD